MKQIERERQRTGNILKARELATLLAFAVSLFITYKLWDIAAYVAEQARQTTFSFRAREATARIQQRVLIYQQVLRSTAGLFNASGSVDRSEFRAFIDALELSKNYPGVQGIGYTIALSPADREAHVASVRREGFPNYRIEPPGERPFYSSILYLEPFSGSNLRAFGYDMFSEPVRRAAMERARDTGLPAMSGKVTLVQETSSHPQTGFLIYVPIYRKGAPVNTVAERRSELSGWVYAPFRMGDFMTGLLGEQSGDLDIEIYDDDTVSERTKMYDSSPAASAGERHALSRTSHAEAGGRRWTIVTTALPAFEARMSNDRPQIVLRAGIAISLLIGLLVWVFLDDRARAFHAADQAMQLALYDALTGLPNRKLLDERLKQAIANARRDKSRLALLFIDLDKFKPVNDNYGHAYGDLLLKEVAQRLHGCMRESDTAARIGGDEFVALLPHVEDSRAAAAVADKILRQLNLPYEIAGHVFEISASIGGALYPDNGTDGKTLIKSADEAMYEAKDAGRSTIRFKT
jgi:diguanylate cyclase (GGDEF)-like protein